MLFLTSPITFVRDPIPDFVFTKLVHYLSQEK